MTLHEALATGLRLRIVGMVEWREPAESYDIYEINSEWEVEPQEYFYISVQDLRFILKNSLYKKFKVENRFLGVGYEVQEDLDNKTINSIMEGIREWKS